MRRSGLTVTGSALAAAVLLLFPAVVAAAPEFIGYEGKNAIHEGQGGEKKFINGVDFWFNGEPPRKFKVLGSVSDRRMKTGIYGMIRMSGLETDIAKAAAAAGGDAVILQSQGDDLLGVSGFSSSSASVYGMTASAFGSSFSAPIKAHESRYIVVKYLPDEADAAGPAAVGGTPLGPVKMPEPTANTQTPTRP